MESPTAYEKLQGVASWVGISVAAAFFSSLERCSCINLPTTDDPEDDEAFDNPLMLSQSSLNHNSPLPEDIDQLPV